MNWFAKTEATHTVFGKNHQRRPRHSTVVPPSSTCGSQSRYECPLTSPGQSLHSACCPHRSRKGIGRRGGQIRPPAGRCGEPCPARSLPVSVSPRWSWSRSRSPTTAVTTEPSTGWCILPCPVLPLVGQTNQHNTQPACMPYQAVSSVPKG